MNERVGALEQLRAAVSNVEGLGFAQVSFRFVGERAEDGRRIPFLDGLGVVDFRCWRCAVDFGAYALVSKDGRLWQGASGLALSELGDPITPWMPTPLTLTAFAEAAIEARRLEPEAVVGEDCIPLRAFADLRNLPPSRQPTPMPAENLPDPARVPFDALLAGDGTLRRLRWQGDYQPSPDRVTSVELDYLSVSESIDVDWTKTPVYQPLEDDPT